MPSYNRNPTGKNQYEPVLKADDKKLQDALEDYHRRGITNNGRISELLFREHSVTMKARTVKKRRNELKLLGSWAVMKHIPHAEAEQHVIDVINEDLANQQGVRTVKNAVSARAGVHLPYQFVSEVMHLHFPEGFARREPTSKKIRRVPKAPLGVHECWAGDGHDKLYAIGFPIWAVVDDATGKWLGAWVVPSNRMANVVAYLYLCLVEKYGGIPLQFSTDCGSETTLIFGFANALRDIFHPEYDSTELPAHTYIRSIHNISIERSWLRLCLQFGDAAIIAFHNGHVENGGPYQPDNPVHYEICQWLWPKLLQQKLNDFMYERNSFRPRKVKGKSGPNGMSRNIAFSLPHEWGGKDLLLPVDVSVIQEIKTTMGGDDLLNFVSPEYSARVQPIYDSLGVKLLMFQNIWEVFGSLLTCLV
ncbi:hypothetical protein P691DRAFT_796776 [Macrolepiota fuliginosa MF-IS2]|uniref:Integrase core domain-containing protein n=1 Tax=Macrolepiota fuliginosa MF-IS2 TaxID=1400762 RepID=A0A9P5XHG8_9AGAR|nr:hypothetical protein P691DRAFT_796776 [Macrolepiota fuliginosa MF-IS2]